MRWRRSGRIQAGKDVYVEKPVSHNVWEGRQIVNAARKYNRIVQTGTQSRSSRTGIFEAVEWVQAGNLGKIKLARGLCYKRRRSIGKIREAPAAGARDTVDYDLWCGPAPKEPLHAQEAPLRLALDLGLRQRRPRQPGHPPDGHRPLVPRRDGARPRVWSVGGRLGYEDDGETPNTQIVYHDYAKAPLIFEVRGLPAVEGARKDMDKLQGRAACGVIVECEGGYVVVPSYTGAIAYDKDGKEIKSWKGAEDHFKNFITACRSRRTEDLNADILEGHLSSAPLPHREHLLSARQEGEAGRDPGADQGRQFAAESFGRMKEHLAKNEVDVTKDHAHDRARR